MFSGPLLVSLIPGVVLLLVTWWLKRLELSFFVRMIPGMLTLIAVIILCYIGFVRVRGFEGAAYGILAFFLITFATISFVMAKDGVKKGD